MTLFGSKLGCFMVINLDSSGSRGAELKLPTGLTLPSSAKDPILVTGVSASQVESTGFVKCFNDVNYMYAFGHNPSASTVTVSFMEILKGGNNSNVGYPSLSQHYANNRVSQKPKLAKLTIPTDVYEVYQGYIVSMSMSTASTESSIQNFNMTMALLDCQPNL